MAVALLFGLLYHVYYIIQQFFLQLLANRNWNQALFSPYVRPELYKSDAKAQDYVAFLYETWYNIFAKGTVIGVCRITVPFLFYSFE